MGDLFCHAATFARIADRLKPFAESLTPLTMDDQGTLSRPWGGAVPKAPDLTVVYGTQDAYFSPAAKDFFRFLISAPSVAWYQSSAAGIEHPLLRAMGQRAEAFTSSHAQSAAIAEWVLWAGLDHFQNGRARRAAQIEEKWSRIGFRELGETRWLIIGFGHIGQATGARLRALGAHVTGVRRTPGSHDGADAMVRPAELKAVLGAADAVVVCPPLTPETENMADTAFFEAMKPDALFINVGRGKLVDEAALLVGLDAGQPGSAYLDVVREEPLPVGDPIWSHPAITLTPHISALTEASKHRSDDVFIGNLEAFLAGRPLKHLVPHSVFLAD
ncbi:MAG: NAD(P)-dependent oxidoreductase [Pseudomonadota bacterium]